MKIPSLRLTSLIALLITAGSLDAQTILSGLITTNDPVPVNHGSNEAGTPDIALNWITSGDARWDQYDAWNGRGSVYQLQDSFNSAQSSSIEFIPNLGNAVTITSFYLDEWAGGGDTSVEWTISGTTSGTLMSGIWDDFNTSNDSGDNGGRSIIVPNVTGANGETLTLGFFQTSGDATFLAMDDLSFSQVAVPEASTFLLIGFIGLSLLIPRRRA